MIIAALSSSTLTSGISGTPNRPPVLGGLKIHSLWRWSSWIMGDLATATWPAIAWLTWLPLDLFRSSGAFGAFSLVLRENPQHQQAIFAGHGNGELRCGPAERPHIFQRWSMKWTPFKYPVTLTKKLATSAHMGLVFGWALSDTQISWSGKLAQPWFLVYQCVPITFSCLCHYVPTTNGQTMV